MGKREKEGEGKIEEREGGSCILSEWACGIPRTLKNIVRTIF